MKWCERLRLAAIGAAILAAATLRAADVIIVKAGCAHTASGDPISPCAIVIEGGKIARIEKELAEIPQGAAVLSADAVMPGIIDAMSSIGLRSPRDEESREVTPRVRVADLFDPTSPDLFRARARGITLAHLEPGADNVIGGLCALVAISGPPSPGQRLILNGEAALKATLGPAPTLGNVDRWYGPPRDIFFRRPATRMAVNQMFREAFGQAKEVASGTREATSDLAVMARVLADTLPLRVEAQDVIDIRVLLGEARRLGITPVLEDGLEAHKEARALAELRIPVVLAPPSVGLRMRDPGGEIRLNNAGILAGHGVKIAFGTGGLDVDPLFVGAMAVRHGLPEEAALRALTLWPAEILGIQKDRGSIEVGKVADLILLSGPPFSGTARVIKVIAAGKVVFPEGGR